MTAVAPPLNFQPTSRTGWSSTNGAPNGLNSMSADEVSRMFMPRRSVQRANSSSSIASSASSSSTISASSVQTNGSAQPANGDNSGWGTRKKPSRPLWTNVTSKAEPIAGLSTARPQSIASSTSGPSAQSAMSALHTPSSMLPSQHQGQSQAHQQNGAPRQNGQPERAAILHLSPLNGTFERKTITVPFYPEVLRIGRQTNTKTIPTPLNGYFDSKVLSRQHAEIWADPQGKIWIRDVKSSNGTFVNGHRLSQENRDSDPHEMHEGDLLELGIDIVSEDQKTIVHHKVAARVEHAGIYSNGTNVLDINFGDMDPSINGLGQPLGNGMGQMRGRTGSQGSMGSARIGSQAGSVAASQMTSASQQRPNQFWLQPVTMEQVVKRINAEIKQAKQQSHDLKRTSDYIENLLTTEPKKEHTKPSPPVRSSKTDLKARFSDPPAPPPQQPLPEKPDVAPAVMGIQPQLRRSDTERPKSNSSPIKADPTHQISLLAEALSSAKREIDTHVKQVKSLEELINQERLARESAEERAKRLEEELLVGRKDTAAAETEDTTTTADAEDGDMEKTVVEVPEKADSIMNETPSSADELNKRLQERVETMAAEMSEMKQLMEQYRQRAERAEAESESDRKSLAEMVEKFRQEEAERVKRATRSRSRRGSSLSKSASYDGTHENGVITAADGEDEDGDTNSHSMMNGHIINPDRPLVKESGGTVAFRPSASDQLGQSAPFISMIAVVIIGVGWMAYLNSWQPKTET